MTRDEIIDYIASSDKSAVMDITNIFTKMFPNDLIENAIRHSEEMGGTPIYINRELLYVVKPVKTISVWADNILDIVTNYKLELLK
jgi:hypothetical protein